jgi:hypothetical protein
MAACGHASAERQWHKRSRKQPPTFAKVERERFNAREIRTGYDQDTALDRLKTREKPPSIVAARLL